jgi:hypothetical protein
VLVATYDHFSSKNFEIFKEISTVFQMEGVFAWHNWIARKNNERNWLAMQYQISEYGLKWIHLRYISIIML